MAALDPERMLFSASDVEFVRRRFERNLKSVYLFKGDLHPAFEIWDLFVRRARARGVWIEQRLLRSFDFELPGAIGLDRAKAEWPDADSADVLWEQWLQVRLTRERLNGLELPDAIAELRRQEVQIQKEITRVDSAKIREYFLNSVLQAFDPHSGYFSRESVDQFDRMMSTGEVGLGFELRVLDGQARVSAVDPASPADRAGIIVGDTVVSLAERGGHPLVLANLPAREITAALEGEPDTEVAVTVKSSEEALREVVLKREWLFFVQHRARGAMIRIPRAEREHLIGCISLPAFYGPSRSAGRAKCRKRQQRCERNPRAFYG